MGGADMLFEALERAGISYEVLEHEPTDRALEEARALGLDAQEVAKTIVVTTSQKNYRVLLPASERIDISKLRDVLEAGKELHLVSEEALSREYGEFELGAVPPLGGRDDEVVVDRRLEGLAQVVFEAGSHDRSVRVSTAELLAATGARVADVSAD